MIETIGEQLKKARLDKGISLEEAAETTLIRVRYLQALEADDFSVMPSAVQGRGFLRIYAEYLGLNARSMIEAVANVSPPPQEINSEPVPEKPPAPPSPPVEPEPVQQVIIVEDKPSNRGTTQPLEPPGEAPAWKTHFIEIGEKLRHQREVLGLTLDDIEHYTHLRAHYLRALENGSLDDLPSPVQARGMLNNYARFLNMDADQLLIKFADGLQTRLTERQKEGELSKPTLINPIRPPTRLRQFISGDMVFTGALVILFFLLLLWGVTQIAQTQNQEEDITLSAPGISDVLLTTPSTSPMASESPTTQASVSPTRGAAAIIPPASQSTADATEIATLIPDQDAPVQVYIVAKQRTWMRVIADGKKAFDGRVILGNAYPFSANETIEIIVGNGAALQIFFQQDDLGIMGLYGQVVDRIYTAAGVMNPTPTITPTPTSTPKPTNTPVPSATPRPSPTNRPTPTATTAS